MDLLLRKEKASVHDSSASAPGSLMLMGEHAVLQGSSAISCAVTSRMHVSLKRLKNKKLIIHSALGTYESSIDNIAPDPRFRFVLACFDGQQEGLELTIESEFSHTVGLGSSAAVTVATLGALLGPKIDRLILFQKSVEVVRRVQKIGSGADVAASIFGGAVFYRMDPLVIEPLSTLLPLTLIYSGSKMTTIEVINRVLEAREMHPTHFGTLFNLMDQLTHEAKRVIIDHDLKALGALFNLHHGLQEALGTANRSLAEIVHLLREHPSIYGAKISGSGLGDCCIGLGACELQSAYQQIPVAMSLEGVKIS